MSAELRKSTGSDIKRLQEMVKRLEVQNAQLKNTDNRRTPNNGIDNMVKVKLNLDDVPLLDLNAMVEEDEDTWLYVSPKHPPSAEQKKISPYKYLKDSLDVPELNKVRGSLLAKLESIAAQEEALSRSPPHSSVDGHHHNSSVQSRPARDNSSVETTISLSDDDDNEHVQVTPRRRVPLTTASHDDSDLVVKGLRRRGAPSKPIPSANLPQSSRPVDEDDDSDDSSTQYRPQRRVPAFNSSSQENSSLVVKGPLKRRGASPQPRASLDDNDDDDDGDSVVPQRRNQVSQEHEDLVVKGPLRRRGPGTPQARQPVAASPLKRRGESPQTRASLNVASFEMDDDDENDGVVPQRRVQVSQEQEDLVVKGPLRRRGGPPQARQPVAAGVVQSSWQADSDEDLTHVQPRRRVPAASNHYQDDYSSSWQREELRSDHDVPIVTAVRRREPNQVRRREPGARPRTAEDIEVRRRSLPQAPTQSRGSLGQVSASRRPNTPPHTPSPRKQVTPRGQLAAPRRVPTPRGVSPARSNGDDSWSEGFY